RLKAVFISGRVRSNRLVNQRVLNRTPVEELFVAPGAGAGGWGLGAAPLAYNTLLGKPRDFAMKHAYWGTAYSETDIAQFLRNQNIPYRQLDHEDELLDEVVERLIRGKVVGWSQGRFEWGPRALGNRSILA